MPVDVALGLEDKQAGRKHLIQRWNSIFPPRDIDISYLPALFLVATTLAPRF